MRSRLQAHANTAGRCWRAGVCAALLAAGISVSAQTTSGEQGATMFRSEALNLRFAYPSLLERREPAAAVTDGQISMLGLGETKAQPGGVAACLRPLLLLGTPRPEKASTTAAQSSPDGSETTVTVTPAAAGTLLLAELDATCLSGAEQASRHKELPDMAQQFLATPGMAAVAQPASYSIGSQKVYMAAAQGHPETPPPAGSDPTQRPTAVPFTIFTMAVATNWNNHLLVWLMSANQVALLDRMSKSTVRFGRAAASPLYPLTLGHASPAGSPQ